MDPNKVLEFIKFPGNGDTPSLELSKANLGWWKEEWDNPEGPSRPSQTGIWFLLSPRFFQSLFPLFFFIPVQDLKGLGYEKGKPVGLVGVTELSEAQKKQLKEQQEVIPKNPPQIPPCGNNKGAFPPLNPWDSCLGTAWG